MPLTASQLRRYWQAFRPAWQAHAGRANFEPCDREVAERWRHEVMAQECHGKQSTKDLDNSDFDAVMLRFAQEAGDFAAVAYWSESQERRMRHLLKQKLAALDRLDPMQQHGPAYLSGILRKARLQLPLRTLDDIPFDHLRTALQILDTHLRRLRRRTADLLEPAPF